MMGESKGTRPGKKEQSMRKQHILFDLDGTLTDSMPGITRAVQYALRRYGIEETNLDALKPIVGPPLTDSFMEFYGFSEKDAHEAVYVYREYYNERGWAENEPYEGIVEMLRVLQEDNRMLYVATSKPEAMAKRVLEHFHLLPYFKFAGGASEDGTRVRKDDVIRYVMEQCSLTKKDQVIMVGDRKHDIEGAHQAGIPAVGVLYGYGGSKELLAAGADWIAATPKEVSERIQGLG